MANDFLTSSVIPGSKIEHHEHRRLITVLAVVIVIAILGFLGYRWNASKQFWPTNDQQIQMSSQDATEKARIGERLEKAIVPVTASEKKIIGERLLDNVVPMSQSEKEAAGKRLLEAAGK